MARPREPLTTGQFRLTLGGHEAAGGFREVSGLTSETEVAEEIEGSGRPFVRKVPRAHTWGNITLKRGVDTNTELWKWRKQVLDQGAEAARVDGTIELLDAQGRPIATYHFFRGWPSKYTGPDLNAASNDVAIEELEITHEGLDRS